MKKHHDKQAKIISDTKNNMQEYYRYYLKDVLFLKLSTIKHYIDGLTATSNLLQEKGFHPHNLYEINNPEKLESIWIFLQNDIDFKRLNKKKHNDCSSAINHYLALIDSECLRIIANAMTKSKKENSKNKERNADTDTLDISFSAKECKEITIRVPSRSKNLRQQVLERANYQCAIDHSHKTFMTKSNKSEHWYMEAHHIIPLKYQRKFSPALDTYANMVCLCPTCHRKIHFGLSEERKEMIDKLYEQRKKRLFNNEIKISKEDFEHLILKDKT